MASRIRRRSKYYSSKEKDLVRKRYDLPLIEAAARRKDGRIRYFGLPGEEAKDLQCWGRLCEYVAAVEVFKDTLRRLEHRLNTQFGMLSHRTHLGDVDEVILRNRGAGPAGHVSRTFKHEFNNYIWDFDVIYLDYFGKIPSI